MQLNLVESHFVGRFTDAVRKLGKSDNPRILLAVSGGPDSLALMLLAYAAMPDRIVAATIDHQLRPEAADEAEYVAALCAERNIPHYVLRPDQPISGNLQSEARAVRYALLQQQADDSGCNLIATAHHADDQLETLLMRLARGSGVDGMSGIRPRNGNIVRPLLGFCKSELEGICDTASITPVRDPSNDNADFDRVAIRRWLTHQPHPLDSSRANRTASALQDAGTALKWMTQRLAATQIHKIDDEIQCDAYDLPHELRRRLVLKSLEALAPALSVRGDTLEQLIDDLANGKTTTVGNILCKGGETWRFTVAPPRRSV